MEKYGKIEYMYLWIKYWFEDNYSYFRYWFQDRECHYCDGRGEIVEDRLERAARWYLDKKKVLTFV